MPQRKIAMELVDGVTLRKRMAAGTLETGEAVRVARVIAKGLAVAYCRWVGKDLPTLFHWSAATAQDQGGETRLSLRPVRRCI